MSVIDNVLENFGYRKQYSPSYDEIIYGLSLEDQRGSDFALGTSPTPVNKEMPMGKKQAFESPSGVGIKRVPREHLEILYFRDDVCYNGINLMTRLAMSNPLRLVSSDKDDQDYLDLWSYNTDLNGVVYETFKAALMYGIGWMELIWGNLKSVDTPSKKILSRLDTIDCKFMDFFRDGYANIKYNKYGFPEGYAQIVPPGTIIPEARMVEGMVYVVTQLGTGRAMRLWDDEVAYFTFETVGSGADGIGVLEPQYDLVRRKKSIEKGHAQSVLRRGNTRYHVKNGNEKYRPGPDEREHVKRELKALKPEDDIVSEWWTDIKVLEAQDAGEVNDTLKYYIQQQAACMGIPVPYVTGRGEDTNRSTLADQKNLFFRGIDSMKLKFVRQFERQVVPYLKSNRDFKSDIRVMWEPLSMDDKAEKSLRIQRYIKSGAITPTVDVENVLRKLEGLEPIDKRPEVQLK